MQLSKLKLSAFGMSEWEINAILATYWDPLGTIVRGGYKDEYRSYAAQLATMIRDGAPLDRITHYLCEVETAMMLLTPNRARAARVAYLILKNACT